MTAAVAAILAATCAACAPAQGGEPPEAVATLDYPPPSSLTTMAAPQFRMREYRLDVSCSVEDYTDALAALSVNTGKEYPSARIEILNLDSGKRSVAVSAPVTPDVERYDILACRISDKWIAWEEVSPGETQRPPEEVFWRLYVAPMPSPGSIVTSPTLVDGARLKYRGRPMFAFRGDELVWATNDREAIDGVSKGRKGVVRMRRPGGATIEVCTLPAGFKAFNISEGSIVVARNLAPGDARQAVRVFGPDDKRVVVDVAPPRIGVLQHFPAYHEGDVAFRVSVESKPDRTALVVRRRDGSMLNLGPDAMDPCFAGDYLFFDQDRTMSASSRSDLFEIWGMRLHDRATFVLASSKPQGEGVWQTALAASGYRDSLVLYNDRSGWMDGRRVTDIRVYRGLETSSTTSGEAR